MRKLLSDFLDIISGYFATRKGALVIYGMILIFINWIIAMLSPTSFLGYSNTFMHIGLLVAFLGILLKWIL